MLNNKPVKEFRSGKVKGSVWATQERDEKTDREYMSYSVSIVKSYKKDDKWSETTSFFPDELPRLALIAQKCFEYVALRSE